MAVRYFEQDVSAKLKDKRKLSQFLLQIIRQKRPDLKTIDLTYIFCNDTFLLDLNQRFLNHDTLTDIITFDMSENNHSLLSEIYISVERIAENARKFENAYLKELHRIIFHGTLHLCGFKDKTPNEKAIMTQEENHCLSQYFQPHENVL
ncbi:MAG: rRNA maturation RNase YbeY [Bacteroidetes bacterium]|nr:rRNA maturation RNase YbeY [Bacteroidota bacterium]MBS1774866.1 rRNA maturation RNase YbeY [Bacteroidota bacterium]